MKPRAMYNEYMPINRFNTTYQILKEFFRELINKFKKL